jgi:hypothetical protein
MADGIRIQDAAIEISPEGLQSLLHKRGAAVTVSKLDLSVSPEALNTLIQGLTPEGTTPPTVECGDSGLVVTAEREGQPMALDLRVGGLRVEISAGGVRLVTE